MKRCHFRDLALLALLCACFWGLNRCSKPAPRPSQGITPGFYTPPPRPKAPTPRPGQPTRTPTFA